jgi:hypothetical protein
MGTWSPLSSPLMGGRGKAEQSSRDIFKRLADHGVPLGNYGTIKKIVAFDLPQWRLLFSRQFEHRTISQVLQQIERWKASLSKDFLLLPNQKAELEKWILGAESLAWQALIQANFPQVGPWKLGLNFVPTGQDDSGSVYIFPGQRITAFNQETKETREVLIPVEEFNDPARYGDAYRKAFKTLGIWDLLQKGPAGRGLISARKQQGWPVFTHNVIPRLYEYLIPHYEEPGHYSNRIDSPGRRRPARFPRKLLRDMLEILRMEHPHVFGQTTVPQLKAVIQKYLDRKEQSTKSTH